MHTKHSSTNNPSAAGLQSKAVVFTADSAVVVCYDSKSQQILQRPSRHYIKVFQAVHS
jgi:hypothetical protein